MFLECTSGAFSVCKLDSFLLFASPPSPRLRSLREGGRSDLVSGNGDAMLSPDTFTLRWLYRLVWTLPLCLFSRFLFRAFSQKIGRVSSRITFFTFVFFYVYNPIIVLGGPKGQAQANNSIIVPSLVDCTELSRGV